MKRKTVAITGARTGIGYHLATYLSQREYTVFAGVRKEDELSLFSEHEHITPVLLDVTNQRHISDFAVFLENHHSGKLDALVNNAGIGDLGFLCGFSEEDFKNLFEVNVVGPWKMVKTLILPLNKAKGRVVNIGSQGGMMTKALFGAYSMTKYALEAFTETLVEELGPLGMHVSVVQPGGIRTPIGEKSQDRNVKRFLETGAPFKEHAQQIATSLQDFAVQEFDENQPESNSNRRISEPIIVSEAVFDALNSDKPKRRYLVGTKWEGNRVIYGMIEKLLDENDNPVHNYSREDLIAILDEKIAERQAN